MAKLYATSPNGTAKGIQLETMNISYIGENDSGYMVFPNNFIIQFGSFNGGTTNKIIFPISFNIWGRVIISPYEMPATDGPQIVAPVVGGANVSEARVTGYRIGFGVLDTLYFTYIAMGF